jgi:hypothetical protein
MTLCELLRPTHDMIINHPTARAPTGNGIFYLILYSLSERTEEKQGKYRSEEPVHGQKLYPHAPQSIFFAFYGPQSYGGGIPTHLHMEIKP